MEGLTHLEKPRNNLESIRATALEKLFAFENAEHFIDAGGVGKVYNLPQGYCLKVIEDRHNSPYRDRFDLGNTPYQEAKLQEQLQHTNYTGKTRVPAMFAVLNATTLGDRNAIIMERLNATNLRHIINGEATVPESFELNAFFEDMENFVHHMHKQEKVAHMDLYARNIMVDNVTASPYVIDFGRAVRLTENMPEQQILRCEDHDWETLDEAFKAMDKLLK